MQGLQDPETQSQGCWDMAWRSNRHILAGWPWSRWRCMDNWVPLADQWKTVGMVSSVLGSCTQGGRGGGRVCPDNSPSGTWVKSVLKQKQQRAGFQQAPSAANNTVESQELTVGPVARIHLEPPVGGRGRGTPEERLTVEDSGGRGTCKGHRIEDAPGPRASKGADPPQTFSISRSDEGLWC